jgi:hypothetical protein
VNDTWKTRWTVRYNERDTWTLWIACNDVKDTWWIACNDVKDTWRTRWFNNWTICEQRDAGIASKVRSGSFKNGSLSTQLYNSFMPYNTKLKRKHRLVFIIYTTRKAKSKLQLLTWLTSVSHSQWYKIIICTIYPKINILSTYVYMSQHTPWHNIMYLLM